jgi:hypothetical protein
VFRIDALIFGTIATTIIFLINQLFFILITAYSGLAGIEHEFWSQYKDLIWQVLGIATLCCSMMLGGMLVRWMVDYRQALHGFAVAALTSGLFIWSSGDRGELNLMSVVVFIAGAASGALGAHYSPWPKVKVVAEPV